MENVVAMPGFKRGSVVRWPGGPNCLVVRSYPDRTVFVVCEGEEDGALRLREAPTASLALVVTDTAPAAENARAAYKDEPDA